MTSRVAQQATADHTADGDGKGAGDADRSAFAPLTCRIRLPVYPRLPSFCLWFVMDGAVGSPDTLSGTQLAAGAMKRSRLTAHIPEIHAHHRALPPEPRAA